MDIMMGLSAISQTLAITKELRSIDREMDVAELKLRLSDLVGGLLEAKEALQDAKEERRNLIEQIAELKTKLTDRGKLEDENGLLFTLNDNGSRVGEPFCNHCYVNDEKMFRLIPSSWNRTTKYDCTHCNFMHLPEAGRVR